MSHPFETPPSQPPKSAAEDPSRELTRTTGPQIPGTPVLPEQSLDQSQLSVQERTAADALTPEQREQATRMLEPIRDPALNTRRRQEAKDRQLLSPDRNGPAVPSTAGEIAEYERRYDSGWKDEPSAASDSLEENESLENLRRAVELMDDFELKYPLPELHAITAITLDELVNHPIRKPANIALVHIRKAMNLIPKRVPELDDRFLRLSQAVGMYNSLAKTVDHDRT